MHKNGAKATGSTTPSSFQVLPPTQNTDNNTMLSPENFLFCYLIVRFLVIRSDHRVLQEVYLSVYSDDNHHQCKCTVADVVNRLQVELIASL